MIRSPGVRRLDLDHKLQLQFSGCNAAHDGVPFCVRGAYNIDGIRTGRSRPGLPGLGLQRLGEKACEMNFIGFVRARVRRNDTVRACRD